MLKRFLGILLLVFALCPVGMVIEASDPNDAEGGKDPALFSRMPGYHIYRYEDIQFDQFEFKVGPNKTQIVEGRHLFIYYDANDNITIPSPLQIGRNYLNAVKAVGGQLVYEYHDPGEDIILKIVKNGMETWAYLNANGNGAYTIHIIEKQAMNQDVVANAQSMAQDIKNTGKAAIYGIYFDTGKAIVKPDSDPALQEISKMLQADPKLKLYVVGHTDNQGSLEYNMKLSKDRADAVVKSLVSKYGVNTARLQAFGVGPLTPAASNLSEEGRAKNRRVELAAQ